MKVRAKFRCVEKTQDSGGYGVKLHPVVGGSDENEEFFKYTPCGSIEMSTINAAAAAAEFEVDEQYYVDFIRAD